MGNLSISTEAKLPDLPVTVEIPKTGNALSAPRLQMQGKAGKSTRVLVNHFEIQSLPVVKTYLYHVGHLQGF